MNNNDDNFEVVWDGHQLVVATAENSASARRERERQRERQRQQDWEWGDAQFKCRD